MEPPADSKLYFSSLYMNQKFWHDNCKFVKKNDTHAECLYSCMDYFKVGELIPIGSSIRVEPMHLPPGVWELIDSNGKLVARGNMAFIQSLDHSGRHVQKVNLLPCDDAFWAAMNQEAEIKEK